MRNVVLRVILLSLVALVAGSGVLGSGPASAHAALIGTDPKDGSSYASAPSTITLTFNENIASPAFVAVTAPDGTKVAVSDVVAVDHMVTATVADPGKRGRFAASYRVVSADGHPVEGTFHYSLTSGRVVAAVAESSAPSFVHRHTSHIVWGVLAAVVAVGLLLAPLRRRHDTDDA